MALERFGDAFEGYIREGSLLMLVQVAISNSPLFETYTYNSDLPLSPGERVEVNFAGRNTIGYVVSLEEKKGPYKIKNITKKIDLEPFLGVSDLELAMYTSKEFVAPPGKVFDLFFPPGKLLQVSDYVVAISGDVDLELPMSRDSFLKKFGSEKLRELLGSRDVKIMHSFDRKVSGKRRIKKVSLNRRLIDLREELNPVWQSIVDYLLSVSSEEISVLEKKLGLNSRSPIETLVRKGVLSVEEVEEDDSQWVIPSVIDLTQEQKKVSKALLNKKNGVSLLYGLTGTGKTEVYFNIMEYWLNRGKQVLLMVPEVSLTPQLLARVRGAFPGRVIRQYHSYMTAGQRQRIWLDATEGNVDILVGTRSSLWVPMKKTGLIIIDEEHDASFYQQSVPFYDGVEVAMKKGHLLDIPVILGSATPRVTHFYAASTGKMDLLELRNRPVGSFPAIEVIDMKEEKNPIISARALKEIENTLSQGKQVFVFVHRKGFSNYVVCHACGQTVTCPHCSVSLTYHKIDNALKCHYCGYRQHVPRSCPSCGSMTLSARGFGTERVENDLQKFFPSASIMRMDRETIDNPFAYEKALQEISKKKSQIIVGTKMITKGLDFPDVEMVLVIDADRLMSFPSYDSPETAFQYIAQVSGRSGRAGKGRAFIQSFNPGNRVISKAFERDYDSFFQQELDLRKELRYPPFVKIVEIVCIGDSEEESLDLGKKVVAELEKSKDAFLELFGPIVPLLSKIKSSYRTKIVLKLENDSPLDFLQPVIKKHSTGLQTIVNGIGGML